MPLRSAVLLLLVASLLAAAPASARTIKTDWQQNAHVADRFFGQIGFIPVAGIQPQRKRTRYRSGATTYVVLWKNFLFNRDTTSALKAVHKDASVAGLPDDGVYTDRLLTSAEKRRFQVLVDLARDADVLVVHRDNPACAQGLSRAQARGIAAGTITRWSELGALPPGQPDAITRRVVGDPESSGSFAYGEPRLGLPRKLPRAIVTAEGGLELIRSGNRGVASITSWSRVRRSSAYCAVAIGGVTPTNRTVYDGSFPEAYPVQFVMHRKRSRRTEDRLMVKEYVKFLKSEKAAVLFRATGVLLAAEPPPAPPASGQPAPAPAAPYPTPTQDHAGRPITAVRDDASVRSALTGVRLEHSVAAGRERFAFDPDGVLFVVETPSDGQSCRTTQGGWELIAGWRYDDNGGGYIARVRRRAAATDDVTVKLPNETPATGYIDSQPFDSDRSLSNGCF
jgi:hypothetical protein